MDLTGNLWFTHNLYFLFVAFFRNITLISMYFKFSRHVTGQFADPFADHSASVLHSAAVGGFIIGVVRPL